MRRGTIDPLASAQAYYAGRIAFACEFDDFNVDTPLNRVLRAAALIVLGSPDLTLTLRRRARAMLARLEDVGPLRPTDLRAHTDRCTPHYTDSLLLAHHVLASTGRTFEGGGLSARTFLIRTPQAVEDGIRHVLISQLPGVEVIKRGMQLQPSTLRLMPDLIFEQGLAVADVKYKVATGEWKRPDLYEVVTFATGFRIGQAAVIEFATLESPSVPTLQVGDVQVSHLTWPAESDCPPSEASGRFVGGVRQWLQGIPRPAPSRSLAS